ncbi:MAG: ATP-binding cassette domain-containing protein [Oscillospiraceae bacterium]|nr:ATP-binding cassette domain-containing protein [Oscillospiraceae bacterium]
MKEILSVRDLGISFGSNEVLKSINFDVYENEVLGVIGPNGAGKTVMLNIISGILKPTHGSLTFLGEDLLEKKIVERTYAGIGRTFQVPRSFEAMSVFENVVIGAAYGNGISEKAAKEKACEILNFIDLYDKRNQPAGKLNLIGRKRLEIGIALASDPRLLLLDEVAGGLTKSEVTEILQIVSNIKARGISIIWIEHVMQTMIEGTDRVMLMAGGKDIITAPAEVVMASDEVNMVYLGADDNE